LILGALVLNPSMYTILKEATSVLCEDSSKASLQVKMGRTYNIAKDKEGKPRRQNR